MTWSTVLTESGFWDGGAVLRVPTSGTSRGVQRTVLRTLRSWTDSFEPFTQGTGITADDVVVAAGPATSLFVYARAHAAALGARSVVAPRWRPELLEGATVAHLTPTMLGDTLAEEVRATWAASLRLVIVAGAPLPPTRRQQALDGGLDVVEYYGAAELSFVALGRGALRPFAAVEVEARDDVLWVRSPWTASDYADGAPGPLRRDGAWCTVGDRGVVRPDGSVVVWGRDDTVLTGGVTVTCAEVESVLRTAPGVIDCVVLGLPHERLGEVVAAVVVGGAREEVAAHCRALLPPSRRPVRWFATDRIPATSAGKVSVADLRHAVLTGEVARWS